MTKQLSITLALLMANLSVDAYAAYYNINIQNKTSNKEIDVKIYSLDKRTDLHIVVHPGETYSRERISISEPASYHMGAWSKDRRFFCAQGGGPMPGKFVRHDRSCSKNVPFKQDEYEAFQNVRSDFEIGPGKLALTLRSVK